MSANQGLNSCISLANDDQRFLCLKISSPSVELRMPKNWYPNTTKSESKMPLKTLTIVKHTVKTSAQVGSESDSPPEGFSFRKGFERQSPVKLKKPKKAQPASEHSETQKDAEAEASQEAAKRIRRAEFLDRIAVLSADERDSLEAEAIRRAHAAGTGSLQTMSRSCEGKGIAREYRRHPQQFW